MIEAYESRKQVHFLQSSAMFFPSVQVFEFNLTGIKYAFFPMRNKVLQTATSKQKREDSVKNKSCILHLPPPKILQGQTPPPTFSRKYQACFFIMVDGHYLYIETVFKYNKQIENL